MQNQFNQQINNPTTASTQNQISPKCNGCGANLGYNPDKQGLYCAQCGAVTKVETKLAARFPISELNSKSAPRWTETKVFSCNSCGAKEVVPGHEMASTCAFCGSPNIAPSDDIAGLKPNAVIPFKISKEKAVEAVCKWAKRKVFAPNRFKKNVVPTDVDGVYAPAFMFDAITMSQYSGVLSRVETFTTFVNGRAVVSSRVVRFPVNGFHDGNFNNIMIRACDTIAQNSLNKIQPFDNQNIKEFNDAYLFGYVAGQHKRDGMECWAAARGEIENNIRRQILRNYPGCSVVSLNVGVTYKAASYRYALIPIYVGHFTHRNKLYNFYINGDTCRIVGKTPISPVKVGLLVGGIVLGVAGVLTFIIALLNGFWV